MYNMFIEDESNTHKSIMVDLNVMFVPKIDIIVDNKIK